MEDLNIAFVLNDGEFRQNLNSSRHSRMSIHAHVEAAFAVDEPDDPLRIEPPKGPPKRQVSEDSRLVAGPFLRIVPMSCGFLLPVKPASTTRFWRSFPHMVWFNQG